MAQDDPGSAESEHYRKFFEAIDQGFCIVEAIVDARGAIVDLIFRAVNRAFARQAGISNVVGRSASALFPGFGPERFAIYQRILETGEPVRAERSAYEGTRRYNTLFARIGEPGSRLVAIVFDDITERRVAEERLAVQAQLQTFMLKLSDALRPLADATAIQREASRILREQLDASSVVYWEVTEGVGSALVESAVPGAFSLLGMRMSVEQYGEVLEEFVAGRVTCRNDTASSDKYSADEKAAYAAIQVNAWAVAPFVKEGELLAALGVYFQSRHDWTDEELLLLQETADRTWAAVERAAATAALRESEQNARKLLAEATKARAQAEAANLAKDEFLATLSHELRTPLAAILLWAGALRSGSVPLQDLARAIDAIVQSAESQARLIEDLLDLSRLTSGKLALSQSAVSIDALVRGAIDVVRPAAEAKGLVLRYEARAPLGKTILDGARVQQVIWNLLTNATKFTPSGGTVTLQVRKREHQLEIQVADTGEGIAPEFMPHIFERFRQADMGEAREHMGLGIGLALSRQLVELHGGTIEAASEGRGAGAVFRVRLPWTPVSEEPDTAAANGAASSPRLPLAATSVLLVEDDANTREGMRWTLTAAGARVVAVASGHEALGALGLISDPNLLPAAARSQPHVIVSDLGLPGMSGYELIQRIVDACRRRGRPSPPACAISAHARDTDRKRAIDSGFDLYIPKPVAPEQLVQAVVDLRDVWSAQVDAPS